MPALNLRDLIYFLLPKPVARNRAAAGRRLATRLLVLSNGRNPTFTYYLEERLARSSLEVEVRDLTERLDDVDPVGLGVILCRYVRPRQLLWLYRNRTQLAHISLLIDDDVAATVTAGQGSHLYKAYLMAIGIAPLPVLNRVLTDVWVSTPALAAVLEAKELRACALLPPFPPAEALRSLAADAADGDRVIMAFHATGSHDAEHAFLVPLVREILARYENVQFEVVAEGWSARLWSRAGLPADRFVLHPKRDWSAYLAETARQRIDILLVPLLQNRMNDVRSSTKRFDATRMGAAAVFSLCPAYCHAADADEILVGNDAQSWLAAIGRLVEDGDLRRRTRNATLRAVETTLASTTASFPGNTENQYKALI